jgi:hypothetical protein
MKTAWFHNYEYRHLLRSPSDYAEWRGLKRVPVKAFERKYSQLKKAFIAAKLPVSGCSPDHDKIISRIFKPP